MEECSNAASDGPQAAWMAGTDSRTIAMTFSRISVSNAKAMNRLAGSCGEGPSTAPYIRVRHLDMGRGLRVNDLERDPAG
jgi:hypothetical protein